LGNAALEELADQVFHAVTTLMQDHRASNPADGSGAAFTSRTSGGKSRRSHEPASGAVARIFAPVGAGAGVPVDQDASILIGSIFEARVCRVRAEEQR